MPQRSTICSQFTDLVLELQRDGIILGRAGGRGVPDLRVPHNAAGQPLDAFYPTHIANLLRQLIRRSIRKRAPPLPLAAAQGAR